MGAIYQIRLQDPRRAEDASELAEVLRFQGADGTYFVPDHDLPLVRATGRSFSVIDKILESALPVRFVLPHPPGVAHPPPDSARLAVLARLAAEQRVDGDVYVRFLGRHCTVPADGFVLDRAGGGRRYVWQIVPDAGDQIALHERFKAIHALLHAPDARVVLSLGSGGLKLFAHAPALRLLERIGCADAVDEVWGTSAGALVALLYSHGLSPEAIEQTGYDLYGGRYRLDLRPSPLRVLRQLLREALLPSRLATDAGFVDCAHQLSEMLAHYCADIRPVRPLYVLAFNLEAGRPEVLTPEEPPAHQHDLLVKTDARDATLASCAVPLLFVPRRIRRGGREVPYIDGSTTEDVPLRSVVAKWDRDRAAGVERRERLVIVYVKLSNPHLPSLGTSGCHRGKLHLLRAVATAGMEAMHERDLELIALRPDVQLVPLRLEQPDPEFFEIARIPDYVRLAKESFPRQLEQIEHALRRAERIPA